MISKWIGDELDYPMFIVTTRSDDVLAGCLVGFATQCSIDPLRFVVFLSKNNFTCRVAGEGEHLAVHVVPDTRMDLAELFGGKTGDEVDKFTRCEWHEGRHGMPLLDACPNWFVGRIIDRIDAGDHVGLVLEPVDGRAEGGPALAFQRARMIEPGKPA